MKRRLQDKPRNRLMASHQQSPPGTAGSARLTAGGPARHRWLAAGGKRFRGERVIVRRAATGSVAQRAALWPAGRAQGSPAPVRADATSIRTSAGARREGRPWYLTLS